MSSPFSGVLLGRSSNPSARLELSAGISRLRR
jgi:hypothetical protein